MIGVLFAGPHAQAGHIVASAMRRSVSHGLVRCLPRSALESGDASTLVLVDVPDQWGAELLAWLQRAPRKLVVFGRMPSALADYLGWSACKWPDELAVASRSDPAPSRQVRASRAAVRYGSAAVALGSIGAERPFERFDFTDEWNNLGFGAIRTDGSCWSLAQPLSAGRDELAAVEIDGHRCGSYAALANVGVASVLWFNRAVGPCDSYEWRIVENFLSGYRAGLQPCHPVLREIPWGYDAAVTSRLDCDEDVESARPLWDAYRELGVPFTLAVHTANLCDTKHHGILRELLAEGGAVLSHTATHAPNWGGSYEAALEEGCRSAAALRKVTGHPVRYAVSPFHQSPPYALRALADTGYSGCIGGIIRNDPEFLLARGGTLAELPAGFIGHSQQCMLHGDCLLAEGDPLAIFKQAFDTAFQTATLFGYLDHPFSERYAYGWSDEGTRIAVHRELVRYIRARASRPLFFHEEAAMDFLLYRSQVNFHDTPEGFVGVPSGSAPFGLRLGVEFRGQSFPFTAGEVLR